MPFEAAILQHLCVKVFQTNSNFTLSVKSDIFFVCRTNTASTVLFWLWCKDCVEKKDDGQQLSNVVRHPLAQKTKTAIEYRTLIPSQKGSSSLLLYTWCFFLHLGEENETLALTHRPASQRVSGESSMAPHLNASMLLRRLLWALNVTRLQLHNALGPWDRRRPCDLLTLWFS